jgi:hypothetical protein
MAGKAGRKNLFIHSNNKIYAYKEKARNENVRRRRRRGMKMCVVGEGAE